MRKANIKISVASALVFGLLASILSTNAVSGLYDEIELEPCEYSSKKDGGGVFPPKKSNVCNRSATVTKNANRDEQTRHKVKCEETLIKCNSFGSLCEYKVAEFAPDGFSLSGKGGRTRCDQHQRDGEYRYIDCYRKSGGNHADTFNIRMTCDDR